MENLPENWILVESIEGNFVFEDNLQEFCVAIDQTGEASRPYQIGYRQLRGICVKAKLEAGENLKHAVNEIQAMYRATEFMLMINRVRDKNQAFTEVV